MRWLHRHPTVFTLVLIVVVFAGIAAFWTASRLGAFDASMSDNLKKVQHAQGGPAWWLGRSFAGMKLTRVVPAGGDRVAAFGYGSCHSHGSRLDPFNAPRCGYPLWISVTNRKYSLTTDDVPKLLDGTCERTRVRGIPAAVGTDGVVVYSGDQQLTVAGPPDLVGRALAALHPANGSASLRPPTLGVSPLGECNTAKAPFEPIGSRLARLSSRLHLPTLRVGRWFDDGQLVNAEAAGSVLVLEYASCGKGTTNGNCGEVLSISSEPFDADGDSRGPGGRELRADDRRRRAGSDLGRGLARRERGRRARVHRPRHDLAREPAQPVPDRQEGPAAGHRGTAAGGACEEAAGAGLRRTGAPAPLRAAHMRPELERVINGFSVRRLELIPEVRLERLGGAVAALWPALPELDFVNRIYGLEDVRELGPLEALYAAEGVRPWVELPEGQEACRLGASLPGLDPGGTGGRASCPGRARAGARGG